jgi:hypothetical protein
MIWVAQHSEAMVWTTREFGFDYQQGVQILLFVTMSRLAYKATQLPTQWILEILSKWMIQLWCNTNHSPLSGKEGQKTLELHLQNKAKAHSGLKCQSCAPFYTWHN